MLKRAIVSLMLLGWLCQAGPSFADHYSDGVAAYQAHNYGRSAQLLQTALKEGKGSPDALFYLGMAYTHLQAYEPARQAFDWVLQSVPPNSDLAVKARNNINYLTKQQITLASNSGKANQILSASLSAGSKDNYLTYVIPGGKVVHFAASKMPLKVYISDGLNVPGWNANMKQVALYAMRTWQAATGGRVSFAQTYTEGSADIVVKWRRNFTDGILGVSPLETVGDTIIRSDVNLAVYAPESNQPLSLGDLQAIAVHEMGHAIGVRGHSPYPDDIMFFSKTRNQSTLSQRDVNTIGMLYRLDADVQNNTAMSTTQTRRYYDLYQQGAKAQSENRAADAIRCYRQALQLNANMPEAKFNLGALLINEGSKMVRLSNLAGAKRNFEEASRLYAEILQSGKPPLGAKDNYDIAQSNLSIINGAMKKP